MEHNQTLLMNLGQGLSLIIGMPTIASWKTQERPKKPKTGTLGFNNQTNNLEYWNGSYWLTAIMNEL